MVSNILFFLLPLGGIDPILTCAYFSKWVPANHQGRTFHLFFWSFLGGQIFCKAWICCCFFAFAVLALHSRKLTWHPKIDTWKRRFLLETIILRFHVSFRECTFFLPPNKNGGEFFSRFFWETGENPKTGLQAFPPGKRTNDDCWGNSHHFF